MNETNDKNQASFDPAPNTDFLREKIKAKPINKKKLLRRTLFTVLAAAIFGVVACLTFLLLEPVISETLNKPENAGDTVETVSFADIGEDNPDEILPEDMYANDTEMIEEALQGNVSEVNQNIQDIENMIATMEYGVDDYQKLYALLRKVSESISYSVVNVIGVTSESGLLDDYENRSQISGVIVADNGPSFLIMARDEELIQADEIRAVYWDGTSSLCTIIGKDATTGIMILSVRKNSLSSDTLKNVKPATLGTSKSNTLKGTPIIALGTINGVSDSFDYGMITASAQEMHLIDSEYKSLVTDILGTEADSGVITNLRGNVIGFIDNSYESPTNSNTIKAIGITELKPLIEKISNSEHQAHLGIQATDISEKMQSSLGLPKGIYINQVEMDSPAMEAGLQNGDILQGVVGYDINNYHKLVSWLAEAEPNTVVKLSVMRPSVDTYVNIDINVTLGDIVYEIATEE